jgi:hypothetical protein
MPGFYNSDPGQTDNTVVDIINTSAVAEAPTWAMMILGFASLGFMAYRKQGLRFA